MSLPGYLLRRLLGLLPIWLAATFLSFAIMYFSPGDPVRLMLDAQATSEQVELLRHELGLDRPFLAQYSRYVFQALQGDLGVSIRGQASVLGEIMLRFPATLSLGSAAMALAVLIGIPLGLLAALPQRRWLSGTANLGAIAALSTPPFALALLALYWFGVRLKWLSITGGSGGEDLFLAALCVAVLPTATIARYTRVGVLESQREDYVRTARAKGLREQRVYLRHILPNALLPVVTSAGILAADLMMGTVFIEAIFSRPGLGRFTVDAILNRDYPQVQGVVLFAATLFVLFNLMVDLIYTVLDPRIRYGQ